MRLLIAGSLVRVQLGEPPREAFKTDASFLFSRENYIQIVHGSWLISAGPGRKRLQPFFTLFPHLLFQIHAAVLCCRQIAPGSYCVFGLVKVRVTIDLFCGESDGCAPPTQVHICVLHYNKTWFKSLVANPAGDFLI